MRLEIQNSETLTPKILHFSPYFWTFVVICAGSEAAVNFTIICVLKPNSRFDMVNLTVKKLVTKNPFPEVLYFHMRYKYPCKRLGSNS